LKIWVDILTPKQLLFFTPLIENLRRYGHEVIVTSRHYREVDLLSVKQDIGLRFVGRHGGASLKEKTKASCNRIVDLTEIVGEMALDYAVSFSSPECARTAFGLGVSHICISDSPHADKVCRLTIPLSNLLLTPWIIPYRAWADYSIPEAQVIRYHALDPAVWLKRYTEKAVRKEDFGLDPSKPTITLRLDETQAAYLLSSDHSFSRRLLDALLRGFRECDIFVLGRYQSQIAEFKAAFGSRAKIAGGVVNGLDLLSASDVFIGMGGTMTAEAALLGVPALSLYQGRPLYTEGYLIKEGLLRRPGNIEETLETVRTFLRNGAQQHKLQRKARAILEHMEDPIELITNILEKGLKS
jgi:predicted glycosyltransferase